MDRTKKQHRLKERTKKTNGENIMTNRREEVLFLVEGIFAGVANW